MLKIPISKQGSRPYCGLHAVKMVFRHFDIKISDVDILDELKDDFDFEGGVYITSLGSFMIKHGFEVTIYCLPEFVPMILSHNDISKREINIWLNAAENDKDNQERKDYMKRFVDSGGKLIFKPVDFRDIQEEVVVNKRPVILSIDFAYIYERTSREFGHYVVVTGMKTNKSKNPFPEITVNDSNESKPVTYTLSEMMHACYIWNSAALFAKKRD